MAIINGTTGNDSLAGTSSNDTINGSAGNDTLSGSAGNDFYDGGTGFDTLDLRATLTGLAVNLSAGTLSGGFNGTFVNIERVWSGDGNDSLTGTASADSFSARGGSDTLAGGAGIDTLWGGTQADTFVFRETGTANADSIGDWASGSDKLLLDGTVMVALGAAGNFASGDARFKANSTGTATDADDRILYNTTTRQIFYDADGSGSGAKVLIATLQTGATLVATDIIVEGGGGGPAPIVGTEGPDSLVGTTGDDTIEGRGGNDTIQGSSGNDRLDGGTGHDSLRGAEGVDTFIGGDGNDTLDGRESLFAENDADVETFDGGLGDDLYIVDNPADVLTDAGGIDTVRAVNMDWTLGAGFENLHLNNDEDEFLATGIGNELDNFMQGGWFVRLEGRGGNDSIVGSPQDDILLGGDGNDTISGGQDPDTLDGGAGNDVLTGGDVDEFDADVFLFSATPGAANADQVTDFVSARDTIQLDGNAHANPGSSGSFTAGDARFAANSTGTAQDSSDRVVYNTSNGQLWYDADGSGAGAGQLIATLQGAPTLAATDIEIINGSAPAGQTINGTPGNDSLVGGPGNDTINGFAGNDTLVGLGGDDSLVGGSGIDSMDGGVGNDTYVIESFENVSDAGGIDTIIVEGGGYSLPSGGGIENLTIRGYAADPEGPSAEGNELDNVIRDEGPGRSFINGQGGNDTLIGSAGAQDFSFTGNFTPGVGYAEDYGHDVVDGGGGEDFLVFTGNSVAVTVDFRNGTVTGGSPVAASVTFTNVKGAAGTFLGDVMFASDTGNRLWGVLGDDTLTGGAGNDQLIGDDGLDFPADPEQGGNDRLLGGGGNDAIGGNGGADWIDGGAGNDSLSGDGSVGGIRFTDSFVFTVAPGASNADTIHDFISAEDRLVLDGTVHANSGPSGTFAAGDARFWSSTSGTAHDGDDRVIYNTSNGQLWYDADGNGAGAAQLIATLHNNFGSPASLAAADIEIINGSAPGNAINGTSGNDSLAGTAGNDTINGLGGNDTLSGSAGTDFYDGGTGFDTLDLRLTVTGLTVNLSAGTLSGGFNGSFVNIERAWSGDGNDSLTGTAGADSFSARGGSDTLAGAGGVDTLWGGAGNDTFIFRETGTVNADTIGDWASNSDTLALDNATMTALGADGDFVAGDARFAAGAGFTSGRDATDRVVFDTSTGRIYYDADGSGTGAAQLIATVQSGATVTATDIVVI